MQAAVTQSLSSDIKEQVVRNLNQLIVPALLNPAISLPIFPPYHDTTREPTSDAECHAA